MQAGKGAGQTEDEALKFVNDTVQSDSQLRRSIERLNISADAKARLAEVLKLTTKVGKRALRICRKILDFAFVLLKAFPHLVFATVLAVIIGHLFAAIPLIGGALSTAIQPLAIALGVTWGGYMDISSRDFVARVDNFVAGFSGLSA